MTFAELYPALEPGELIAGARDENLRKAWGMGGARRQLRRRSC